MILQDRLPYDTNKVRRLPGVAPLDMGDWLIADEAYAGQMAERDAALRDRRDEVIVASPASEAAQAELMDVVLKHLPEGFAVGPTSAVRPDGVEVPLNGDDPMGTLCRLVQEDLCLMEKPEEASEHILTAASLCFPARWSLVEKFGRPLSGIHGPVEEYDAGVAARVQRLFDGLQPGRPLWRWNLERKDTAELNLSMSEAEAHSSSRDPGPDAPYLRSERQVLVRLPRTHAVVFSIHTYVVRG